MSHIAVMSLALYGHVHPMLGLVAELRGRGHEVTFASGEEFTDLISATGAPPVGYPSVLRSTRTGEGHWKTAAELGVRAVEPFAAERDAALGPLTAAYDLSGRPDVVVFDQVTAVAPVLAAPWGMPRVQFSPTHVLSVPLPSHGAPVVDYPCIVALPERRLPVGGPGDRPGRHWRGGACVARHHVQRPYSRCPRRGGSCPREVPGARGGRRPGPTVARC